jgi:hypothetical protein
LGARCDSHRSIFRQPQRRHSANLKLYEHHGYDSSSGKSATDAKRSDIDHEEK